MMMNDDDDDDVMTIINAWRGLCNCQFDNICSPDKKWCVLYVETKISYYVNLCGRSIN